MSGTANGHPNKITNGESHDAGAQLLQRMREALQAVYDPQSSNESRQVASMFLEEAKSEDAAPYHGFLLATDKSQDFVVRHYALSLLEYVIKHKWNNYSETQVVALRGWILQLAEQISEHDPVYLQTKTAQLWIECAKRSWAGEWMDMDEQMVRIWEASSSLIHKNFVLFILENLSDDIFNGEDTAAAMRESVLSRACVEVFTDADVLTEAFPDRHMESHIRCGKAGWLGRVVSLLETCLSKADNEMSYRLCAVKCLDVIQSVTSWIAPVAIHKSACVQQLCRSLNVTACEVQVAAVDALSTLFLRAHLTDTDRSNLIHPMFSDDVVGLLRSVFQSIVVSADDVSAESYTLGKKLSEMFSLLGTYVETKCSAIPPSCNLPQLLDLFLLAVESPSFVISVPLLVTWSRLLKSEVIGGSHIVTPFVGPLLALCSSRLLRYESLPLDSNEPALVFLIEDIDTLPERHAFIGNYRRYCVQVIEAIVRSRKSDAIYHVLNKVAEGLKDIYQGHQAFSAQDYSKTSRPLLEADAQCTVIEAVMKGFIKWRYAPDEEDDSEEIVVLENAFETWCRTLMDIEFEDPLIRKRVLQLAVSFSTTVLDRHPAFLLTILEHLLTTIIPSQPDYHAYNDAAKEFQDDTLHDLARLSIRMPNQLLQVYDQLEAKINEITMSAHVDRKQEVAYRTFLFTIIHRAVLINPDKRMSRLQAFIEPIKQPWTATEFREAVSSFENFCRLLGLGKARDYIVSRQIHNVEDWSTITLDSDGVALQKELDELVKSLPLRPTKAFISCSTEKIEKGSEPWKVACALWKDSIPIILPNLLELLRHAHAFYNPANWSGLPDEILPIVDRILTDRFWQAGISEGSKDDFYVRVHDTKRTMEGLASTVRGSVRAVRDACYSILFAMSRLDVQFFGFEELPGPLAHAVFADAHCLPSHQLINLLNLVRHMIDDCPVLVRAHFVPPLIATCFIQIDAKIKFEWDRLGKKQESSLEDDDLTGEMKEESVLRQLTYTAVMMLAGFLDPARDNPPDLEPVGGVRGPNGVDITPLHPSMRSFCLFSPVILEPLLLFSAHAIRYRDSRSCGVVLRVMRSIIPEFNGAEELSRSIREFMCSDILQACIMSLNESNFVDLHKDLAQVIASILIYYCPVSQTPRRVLASVSGLKASAIDRCIDYVGRPGVQSRQQRAIVLDLLSELKGVSVSEQGRITKSAGTVRKEQRSKMQQELMQVEVQPQPLRPGSPDLDGVAGMFDA